MFIDKNNTQLKQKVSKEAVDDICEFFELLIEIDRKQQGVIDRKRNKKDD